MNHPEYYYADSQYCEMWHFDCEQDCCGETWANWKDDFKCGDEPSEGENISIYRGESKPHEIQDIFGGKHGFSESLGERIYELLGEDGSEHTDIPDDIDAEFIKWLGGQIEINWFKIINITKIDFTYSGGKWIRAEEQS